MEMYGQVEISDTDKSQTISKVRGLQGLAHQAMALEIFEE
jgi:hypothetical protein